MSEALFRFLVLRPPIADDPTSTGGHIKLAQASDFQKSLASAASKANARDEIRAVAKPFIASDKFVKNIAATEFQAKVNSFSANIDKVESTKVLTAKDVKIIVPLIFGVEVNGLVKSDEFTNLLAGLRDSVIAIKFVQEEHLRPIEALANQLRDLELIQSAAEYDVADRDPPPHSAPEWAAETDYHVKDRVMYKNVIYECLQAHYSLSTWIPPDAPSLWKAVEGVPVIETDITLNRKRNLQLPVDADLKSIIAASEEERKKAEEEAKKEAEKNEADAKEILQEHADLETTIAELVKLNPELLQSVDPEGDLGIPVDPKYTSKAVVARQIDYQGSLRSIAVDRSTTVKPPPPAGNAPIGVSPAEGETVSATADPTPSPTPAPTEPVGAFNLATALFASAGVLTPKGPFAPVKPADRIPRYKDVATSRLSETARGVLSARDLNLTTTPVNVVVNTLRREQASRISTLKELAPEAEHITYTRVGNAYVASRAPVISKATALLYGYKAPRLGPALPARFLDGRIPHSRGKVGPSGVGDLLVVKQTLKGYQGADIAHVENVLKGESKSRSYSKTTRTEALILTETETNTSEEHELISTTRFEMSKEASNTLKEDQSLKAELKVSAKYGPVVSIDASAEGSMSRSKEEVNKSASKFAQDVTERTVKKIAERVLEKQSTLTISEITDKSEHGINNANGSGHISGVYQFLNKVYEAQIFNYGLRTMYDFMVPEPGAFITQILGQTANAAENGILAEKPMEFPLDPSGINTTSIGSLVTRYQATDVLPPPEDFTVVSDQAKAGGGDGNTHYDHGALISIPSGYEAIYATISVVGNVWDEESSLDVTVAGEVYRIKNPGSKSWGTSIINHLTSGEGEGGVLPWAFNTYRMKDLVVTVTVLCRLTKRRMQQWQNETHAKLMTAYKARVAEYEEKLARIKLDSGVTIQGTNPTANLNLIKTELKKNCISILTAQHYELFGSISKSFPAGFEEINLYEAEAEGAYVRFFEQAFEWDQIMYVTYPYFWGRKDTWKAKFTVSDPDPVFDEFLKAGFARVVVPARRNFEGAIDHFMQFGEIWNGGPLPFITSGQYLPIADEIAERTGKPEGETPQGESWDVVVPTTLVKLRPDDRLPTWHKDAKGNWVPDANV